MAYEAVHRFARISARKVRPLADLIRGKHADEALDILRYMPQRGARLLEKVLKSALGNAEDRRARDRAEPGGGRCPGRRRADVQAHSSAGPRHGLHDQEADVAHPRGGRQHPRDAGRHGRMLQQTGSEQASNQSTAKQIAERIRYGSKSQSDRLPHRHHGRLEEPLVCLEAGVQRAADRRLQSFASSSRKSTSSPAFPKWRSSGPAMKSR